MNKEELIKTLKEHFPSKEAFSLLEKKIDTFATKEDFSKLKEEFSLLEKRLDKKFVTKTEFEEFCYEIRSFRKETREEFKVINEKLDEIKPLSKSLDSILEKYPIERIDRLEKHAKLSPFTPVVIEE